MIVDYIENAKSYMGLSSALDRALTLIPDFIQRQKGPGRIEADGEKLYANSAEFKTSLDNARFFEAHRRYIDIHVVTSGEETIQFALASEASLEKEYSEEIEAVLYRADSRSSVHMRPGMFCVFFPGEIHRAGTAAETEQQIKKFVMKVLTS